MKPRLECGSSSHRLSSSAPCTFVIRDKGEGGSCCYRTPKQFHVEGILPDQEVLELLFDDRRRKLGFASSDNAQASNALVGVDRNDRGSHGTIPTGALLPIAWVDRHRVGNKALGQPRGTHRHEICCDVGNSHFLSPNRLALRKAGGLMSGAALKAVPPEIRFASIPAAGGTPKGLTLSSRGQGHAFCARRPRVAPLPILPTLKGSDSSAPPGPRGFHRHQYRRFHLRLFTVFPLRGTWQRSNLFESQWSNQLLTFVTVMPEMTSAVLSEA